MEFAIGSDDWDWALRAASRGSSTWAETDRSGAKEFAPGSESLRWKLLESGAFGVVSGNRSYKITFSRALRTRMRPLFDQSELAKAIHEEAHARPVVPIISARVSARSWGNERLRFARLAKLRNQQQNTASRFSLELKS